MQTKSPNLVKMQLQRNTNKTYIYLSYVSALLKLIFVSPFYFIFIGSYIRIALTANDNNVLQFASKCLGRLAKIGGTLSAELIDSQLKRSLEWLSQTERSEHRKLSAVLVLREIAIATPTIFNVHVGAFVEDVWEALREQNQMIRDTAVEAVRACLDVIAERQNSLSSQWYNMLWMEAQKGMKQNKDSLPALHAGLQVVGEKLRWFG